MSRGDHVGLEQGTLQVDVVVGQGLVDSSQDLLSHILAAFQVVVTVGEDLGLNNGDNAVLGKEKEETEGILAPLTVIKNTIENRLRSADQRQQQQKFPRDRVITYQILVKRWYFLLLFIIIIYIFSIYRSRMNDIRPYLTYNILWLLANSGENLPFVYLH